MPTPIEKIEAERPNTLLVRSVEKAFRVLEAFTYDSPAMGLTEISDKVGIDKSATQRFLHTLEYLGYISKNGQTRKFELTVKSLSIGANFLRSNRIVQLANPYLIHLCKITEETVNLAVIDAEEVVYISRYVSPHIFSSDVVIGSRLPVYCTAAGLAILSRLPHEHVGKMLDHAQLTAHTPHTITDKAELLERVERARLKGYSESFRQYFSDDLSVGAPISDSSGTPVAAISIAVSTSRYSAEQAEQKFGKIVMSAANSIKL